VPTVQTALGPIDAEKLGFTLSHEHTMNFAMARYLPFLFDMEDSLRRARHLFSLARDGGVDSMIDLTTFDLGREVEFIRKVSEASGINVVVATGVWRDIPRIFWMRDPDWIARFMHHEIENGIDGTGIKPGVIKLAQDQEHLENGRLMDRIERTVRAAARVCRDTGVPISTHHWAPLELGRLQVEVFLEEKVPMHLVCIGHSADTTDDRYLEDLLQTGCYLSMDRYPGGLNNMPDWKARNATVKRLVDRGWAGRIMLGHDYPPPPTWAGQVPPQDPEPVRYTFVKNVAIPALLEDGVTEEQVRQMTVEVPKRFLTGQKPLPRDAS
jgi:phosphotriesterase-related protein